jgi:phage gpG-like protein
MINAQFINLVDFNKLSKNAEKAAQKSLYTLAGYITQSAKRSIRKGKKPSKPGTPYHTQTRFMKNALVTVRQNRTAIIKYFKGVKVGALHEFGGLSPFKRGGNRTRGVYPARPVLAPALAKGIADFNKKFPEEFNRYFKNI